MIGKTLRGLPFCLLTLLAGCAALPPVGQALAQPQALVLSQDITIREGHTRTFLQDGAVVKRIDEFRPHCALEIRQLNGPPRTVPAGIYPVTRIQQAVTPVVLAGPGRRYAALGLRLAGGMTERGDAPEEIFEGYHFWLADSAAAGLMRLTCFGTRDLPVDVEPPSLAEINRSLGKLGRLATDGQPR